MVDKSIKAKVRRVKEPPYTIVVPPRRFNTKYNMFLRKFWDPEIKDTKKLYYQHQMEHIERDDEGYRLEDYAAMGASWHVACMNGGMNSVDGAMGNVSLYHWDYPPSLMLTGGDVLSLIHI